MLVGFCQRHLVVLACKKFQIQQFSDIAEDVQKTWLDVW